MWYSRALLTEVSTQSMAEKCLCKLNTNSVFTMATFLKILPLDHNNLYLPFHCLTNGWLPLKTIENHRVQWLLDQKPLWNHWDQWLVELLKNHLLINGYHQKPQKTLNTNKNIDHFIVLKKLIIAMFYIYHWTSPTYNILFLRTLDTDGNGYLDFKVNQKMCF